MTRSFPLLSLVLAFTISAAAQLTLDDTFNAGVTEGVSEGYVSARQPDGKILVGGNFAFGAGRNALIRLNTDGSLDTTFTPPTTLRRVYDIHLLADGKIIIGGNIGSGILRLLPNGTVDSTFNPGGSGTLGTIHNITVQPDGKYILSGEGISSYNEVAIFSVLRVGEDGTLDAGFTSPFTFPAFVEQTALQSDAKIVIGGGFNLPGYTSVARLNTDGTLDTSFASGNLNVSGQVYAVFVDSIDRPLIGGDFDFINQVPHGSIARLNADGTVDTTFDPQFHQDAVVEYGAFSANGQIVLAGSFPDGNAMFQPVERINPDGTVDTTFNAPRSDDLGYHVALQGDGKILLSGWFDDVEIPRFGRQVFVRLDPNGTVDTTLQSVGISRAGGVETIIQLAGGKYLVAGNFYRGSGVPHRSLVRFNENGTVDDTFQSGWGINPSIQIWNNVPDSTISMAEQLDGKVLIAAAGPYNFIGSYDLSSGPNYIKRINTDGSYDTSYIPTFTGSSSIYDLLIQPDGKVIVAGSGLGGLRVLVRLNSDGSLDPSFTRGTTNGGRATAILRQPDGKLIVLGTFMSYLGVPRFSIVRVNESGTLDTSFDTGQGPNGPIHVGALQPDGKILVAGPFTTFNGVPKNGLARLNADGSLDATFDAGSGVVSPAFIKSIVVQPDGRIVIGGTFTSFNGTAANHLVRLNPDGSLDSSVPSGLGPSDTFRSVLLTADQQVLIGGMFTSYSGTSRNNIAKLRTNSTNDRAPFDYDADGRTDFSVFRPSEGGWYLQKSTEGFFGMQWGISSDKITPADFDGDGKTDIAVFRPSDGYWYIANSSNGTYSAVPFGLADDLPAPADYDGDGRSDVAVFRPFDGTWYAEGSSSGFFAYQFGAASDKPTVGDFDGDGLSDFAVYRTTNGEWYQHHSSDGSIHGEQFGFPTDKLAYADYDGDGRTDLAVFRPEDRIFYIRNSQTATYSAFFFGVGTDIPTPGDYDGDGRADISVFRPSDGHWYRLNSGNGSFEAYHFGANGDRPTPTAYH